MAKFSDCGEKWRSAMAWRTHHQRQLPGPTLHCVPPGPDHQQLSSSPQVRQCSYLEQLWIWKDNGNWPLDVFHSLHSSVLQAALFHGNCNATLLIWLQLHHKTINYLHQFTKEFIKWITTTIFLSWTIQLFNINITVFLLSETFDTACFVCV